MANTGKFLLLFDTGVACRQAEADLVGWVKGHPLLKNLSTLAPGAEYNTSPCLLFGVVDRLTPDIMRDFVVGRRDVVAAYVVNSICGDNWEVVFRG